MEKELKEFNIYFSTIVFNFIRVKADSKEQAKNVLCVMLKDSPNDIINLLKDSVDHKTFPEDLLIDHIFEV